MAPNYGRLKSCFFIYLTDAHQEEGHDGPAFGVVHRGHLVVTPVFPLAELPLLAPEIAVRQSNAPDPHD